MKLEALKCQSCGAPFRQNQMKCLYCGTEFRAIGNSQRPLDTQWATSGYYGGINMSGTPVSAARDYTKMVMHEYFS